MGTQTAVECTRCGAELDEEESASPRLDSDVDDGAICDECWREHYCYTCYWCGEYEENTEQDKMLVISEECGGLPAGIYRIKRLPYFISNYFDMWWMTECLEFIRDVPPDFDSYDDYPSGHLCAGCQKRIIEAKSGGWIGQRVH